MHSRRGFHRRYVHHKQDHAALVAGVDTPVFIRPDLRSVVPKEFTDEPSDLHSKGSKVFQFNDQR